MSYQAVDQLINDANFAGRVRSCAIEQAETYKDDARPSWVAVANNCLRGDGETFLAFTRIEAAGPGIAEKADNGDGTIDQAKVTDGDLLSLTQGNWQVVAGLYFNEDGTPIE